MRRLALAPLALALLAANASAATKYVCNEAAEYGLEDGTSPANCFDGWTFPDNTFSAGDVLRVVGRVQKATTMLFTDAGASGNPIRIIGEPGTNAVLDGLGTAGPVLQLGDAGKAASYVIVGDPDDPDGLTVENSGWTTGNAGTCILDSSLGAGGGFNEFYVRTRQCGAYNLQLQKPSPIVAYGTHEYCGDDCIGVSSAALSPNIRWNTFQYFSTRTLTGDALFINNSAVASNPVVEYNTFYWDNPEGRALEKQAMIVGVASGLLAVRYNDFIARTPTTTNHAIAITAATDAIVEGNWFRGFNAAITHFSDNAEGIDGTMQIRANIASGSQYLALLTPSVGTPTFIVDHNSGAGLKNGLRATSSVAANLTHTNNSYGLDGTGGDALYVASSLNSYTGLANNYYPEGASYIENYECGGSAYATAAAYVAACTQEVGTNSTDPVLAGGTVPTSPEGFRPTAAAVCTGAVASRGASYDGVRFRQGGQIGAMSCRSLRSGAGTAVLP